jgi:hydrogenase maturation protein HypF
VAGLPLAAGVDRDVLREVTRLASDDAAWPLASGAGRLFEATGALLAAVVRNDWEGEAAVVLESMAASWSGETEVWPLAILEPGGPPLLPTSGLLVEAARRLAGGEPPALIAASFHATFCALAVELTGRLGAAMPVALGGGCLVNRLLRDGLREGLERSGFAPLLATGVPPGDGGLAYGQAVLAAVAAARGVEPAFAGRPGP